MKKKGLLISILTAGVIAAGIFSLSATDAYAYRASDDGRIHTGVYADEIDLSGMTKEEANRAVSQYVENLKNTEILLNAVGGNTVSVTAGTLGLTWDNKEIVEEAAGLGREGNVVQRYKELKDLEHENKIYDIALSFNEGAVTSVIEEQCASFNQEAVDATLSKTENGFEVVPGQNGLIVDVAKSAAAVKEYLDSQWTKQKDDTVDLVVVVDEPRGKTEELMQVKDVLGSFTTSFKTSASGRSANVRNGCKLINGTLLYPGEQLSVYEKVSPFTEENGYYMAGSYLNGLVVESLGGGICQVSSTLYNAVIRAELQVDERYNHSMVVSYVDLSADAAISGTAKDFKFTNTSEYPIYIEGYTTENKNITFTIYGKEMRDPNRELSFVSETIEQIDAEGEKCVADSSKPVGSVSVQSAHTGYKAKYWKVVKVNGEETERIQLNSSNYTAAPKTATVGTAGDVTGTMSAAIATQSIDYCKAVAASLVQAATDAQAVADANAAAAAAAADAAAGN